MTDDGFQDAEAEGEKMFCSNANGRRPTNLNLTVKTNPRTKHAVTLHNTYIHNLEYGSAVIWLFQHYLCLLRLNATYDNI